MGAIYIKPFPFVSNVPLALMTELLLLPSYTLTEVIVGFSVMKRSMRICVMNGLPTKKVFPGTLFVAFTVIGKVAVPLLFS